MSGTAPTGRRRGRSKVEPRNDHAADPWWTSDEPEHATEAWLSPTASAAASGAASSTATGTRSRKPSSSTARLSPRRRAAAATARRRNDSVRAALGVALTPLTWLGALVQRTPWLRRLVLRTLIVGFVLLMIACSVGVILVNNVVIGRTAELGELDDRRRELRRESALLGDELAKLGAPPTVQRRATEDLGMIDSRSLPTFIYLTADSRTLTPYQRLRAQRAAQQQAAARERRAEAARAAAAAAKASSAATTGASQ